MGLQSGAELEFGGVPGAAAMLMGLPATVYGLNLLCDKVRFYHMFSAQAMLGRHIDYPSKIYALLDGCRIV